MAVEELIGSDSPINVGQVVVGTSVTALLPQNQGRASVVVKVPKAAANGIYIGGTNAVTTSTGHLVDVGDAITLRTQQAVWAIASAGVTVTFCEEQQ